jgi:HPr kinase/phosphorylase
MTNAVDASSHASAVLVGNRAVLIRGPSGGGKSRLAFELMLAGRAGQIPPAVLVGDDRVHLRASGGHLMVRPAPQLAGLIEIRGLGVRRCNFVGEAIVGLVVDLAAADAARLPAPESLQTHIHGVKIPRIPVGSGFAALPLAVAMLTTTEGAAFGRIPADCVKGIGNHMRSSIAAEHTGATSPSKANFRENHRDPLLREGSG